MKSLSLSQPLVLIVIGAPGSGKTYFARQFAQTFAAPKVSIESIVSHLPKDLSTKEKNDIAIELATRQCEELFKTQKTFIVDGVGATRVDRMHWRKQAKECGYGSLFIWIQTDEATARYRSERRNGKKTDDNGRAAMTNDEFTKRMKLFTPPVMTESPIVISGKHTYASQAKVVLKKLVIPREESMRNQPISSGQTRVLSQDTQGASNRRGYLIR
jgi:predicted kinase